jgi:hypothetical protein
VNRSTPQGLLEWRPIPGFSSYEASGRGDIRRAVSFRHYPAGMVLRQRRNRFGYTTVRLSERGIARDVFVHRLVALAFIGPQPTPQHEVAHRDGDKANNHWRNLRWATKSENCKEKRTLGELPDIRGEKHPQARLTEALVLAMRERRRQGAFFREIAAEFGVPTLTAYDAIKGITWSHI